MVILDTSDDNVAGGIWWRKNMFEKFGFEDWLESVGGRKTFNNLTGRWVVEFKDDNDAVIFKLKYM